MTFMNSLNKRNSMLILALVIVAPVMLSAPAKPSAKSTNTASTNAVPQAMPSVFTMPTNPSQGRDPFFPNSRHPYENSSAAQKPVNDVSNLIIKGFVGTGPERSALINTLSFRAGEEGDVITPGGRIHLRCIQVLENSVIIEVDGERHVLTFHDNL